MFAHKKEDKTAHACQSCKIALINLSKRRTFAWQSPSFYSSNSSELRNNPTVRKPGPRIQKNFRELLGQRNTLDLAKNSSTIPEKNGNTTGNRVWNLSIWSSKQSTGTPETFLLQPETPLPLGLRVSHICAILPRRHW